LSGTQLTDFPLGNLLEPKEHPRTIPFIPPFPSLIGQQSFVGSQFGFVSDFNRLSKS